MHKRTPTRSAAALGLMALAAVALAGPAAAEHMGYGYGYGPPPEAFAHGHPGPRSLCGRTGYAVRHLERAVGIMGLNEAQQAAWDDLSRAAEAAGDRIEAACENRDDWRGTAPERLARMEAVMAAGLDAVRRVRPKFEAFYATLSDRQKEALDDLATHRRGRYRDHRGYRH